MRIPAVAIAVAFAGGILLGRELQVSRSVLGISFLVDFSLLIAAWLFASNAKLCTAPSCSLLGWVCLGAIGMSIASRPLPAEHVLSRIAVGELELKTPLRWYGHLRSEPARLPWGVGLEMELSGVETAAGMIPVTGGMRIGFTPKEGEALPEVHAGDEVSVMAQGRLPLMARDFHRVTLMGPLANLFAVPLTGVIVPLGFFTLGGAVMVPPVARVLAVPLGWLVALQGHIVGWFAGFARGSYRIPGPPTWVTIFCFTCGILLVVSLRVEGALSKRAKWTATAGLLLSSLLIATYPFPVSAERGALEVDLLDVAQGDSILLISPGGEHAAD